LFIAQYGNTGGLNGIAGITLPNLAAVIGTPFDGRFASPPTAFRVLAVTICVLALMRLVAHDGSRVPQARVLAAFAGIPIAAILLIALAGQDVVNTRYTAVAAPLLVAAIAGATATLRRAPAILLAVGSLVVAAWGLAMSHRKTGFYPASKPAITYIAAHRQRADVVAFAVRGGEDWPFTYYGFSLLHPQPRYIAPGDRPGLLHTLRQRQRVWLIGNLPAALSTTKQVVDPVNLFLRPYGYHVASAHEWHTASTVVVYLTVPTHR
jgi:hypothetical protein